VGRQVEKFCASRLSLGSDRRFGGVRGGGGAPSLALGSDPHSCHDCYRRPRCSNGDRGAGSLSWGGYGSSSWKSLVASASAAGSCGWWRGRRGGANRDPTAGHGIHSGTGSTAPRPAQRRAGNRRPCGRIRGMAFAHCSGRRPATPSCSQGSFIKP